MSPSRLLSLAAPLPANRDESANGCEKMGMKGVLRRRERRFISGIHRSYAEPAVTSPCPSLVRRNRDRAKGCDLDYRVPDCQPARLPVRLATHLHSPAGHHCSPPQQSLTLHGAKSWGTGTGFTDKNIALPPSPIATAQDTTRDARSYRCEEIGTQAARFRWPPPSTCT